MHGSYTGSESAPAISQPSRGDEGELTLFTYPLLVDQGKLSEGADTLKEADTVQRLIKVFEDVFGYDPMSEITRESTVKDRYCDVALKLDGRRSGSR